MVGQPGPVADRRNGRSLGWIVKSQGRPHQGNGVGGFVQPIRRGRNSIFSSNLKKLVVESGGRIGKEYGENRSVRLDENCFRRVDRFDGDATKYRSWLFEFIVASGQIDSRLGMELKRLVSKEWGGEWPEKRDPRDDIGSQNPCWGRCMTDIGQNFAQCWCY